MLAAMPLPIPTPVSQGGTGATSAAAARTNLGITGGIYNLVTSEAELAEALDAQDELIAVGADITLTANLPVAVDTEVKILPGYTLDLATYQLLVGATQVLEVKGPGFLAGLGGVANSISLGVGAVFRAREGLFLNWSAAASGITASELWEIRDSVCVFFNGSAASQLAGSGGHRHLLHNVEVQGGGTSCYDAIDLTSAFDVRDLRVTGTWSVSATGLFTLASPTAGELHGLRSDAVVTGGALYLGARVIESVTINHNNTAVYFTGELVRGVRQPNRGNVYFGTAGMEVFDIRVSEVHVTAPGITFTGLRFLSGFGQDLQLNQDGTKVHGGVLPGDVVVSADRCALIGCSSGTLEFVGTAYTITVNAGSNDTRIVGCATDAAISDSGTGTIVAGNVVV